MLTIFSASHYTRMIPHRTPRCHGLRRYTRCQLHLSARPSTLVLRGLSSWSKFPCHSSLVSVRTLDPSISRRNVQPATRLSNFAQHPTSDRRFFASTQSRMAGKTIDGTAIAKGIREKLNVEIKKAQEVNPRFRPSLTIIQGLFPVAGKIERSILF